MLDKGLSRAMNARIMGSGSEAIVLAHGYGADQSVWDKILPYLAKHYMVLVFDWCFSGSVEEANLFDPVKYDSYDAFADDLIDLLDEVNLKSSVFVGHSMSGMIGCIASVKRPDLFKRLILIGASPRYINADNYEGGFKKSEVEALISSIESNFYNWASIFPTMTVDSNDPSSVNKMVKSLQSMRPEVALSVAKIVFYSDERDTLEKVLTPCTIVQPSNDFVVPNSVAYYMEQRIKGKSSVVVVDTDGHFPQLTSHPQLINVLGGLLGFEEPEDF